MNYSALIVAAGQGRRMNLGYNKVFYTFQDGKNVLEKTMNIFEQDSRCKQIVIVTQREDFVRCMANRRQRGNVVFVEGGATRQDSVFNGLMAISEEVVMIHDGARPFLEMECLDRLCQCIEEHEACLLTVPCKDTIKIVKNGEIVGTPERSELHQAQTPQAFRTNLILKAYRKARRENISATDDTQLIELCTEEKVYSVMGSYRNTKITTQEDIH